MVLTGFSLYSPTTQSTSCVLSPAPSPAPAPAVPPPLCSDVDAILKSSLDASSFLSKHGITVA
jgi:hypothetical protein